MQHEATDDLNVGLSFAESWIGALSHPTATRRSLAPLLLVSALRGALRPGFPTYASIDDLPGVEDPTARAMHRHEHSLTFEAGSRMIAGAKLAFTGVDDGARVEIGLEKLLTHRMKGLGYSHPEWGHGMWKGETALSAESWTAADVDDTAYENQHVQHLVRARMDGHVGIGVLEQNLLGPYEPYDLTGAFDPPGSRIT